jgi:hypothetical protein
MSKNCCLAWNGLCDLRLERLRKKASRCLLAFLNSISNYLAGASAAGAGGADSLLISLVRRDLSRAALFG